MKMTRNNRQLCLSIMILFSMVKISHETVYTCDPSASCGCSTNSATVSRIVGGEDASASTWGWAVSLSIANSYLCGGSIISNSWIVTAAHCASGFSASQFIVYAGSNIVFSSTQTRSVSRVIVHPAYNSDTYDNDIALLQLSTPLSMSDSHVSQICLPSVSSAVLEAGEWPPASTSVVTIGWGRLNESGSTLPTKLQQVTVQTVDYRDSTCTESISDWHLQFCAGVSGGGKDSCQGDSGGPLMMFSSSNQWILVGVTSNGIGCARPEYSGIYTRVAAYTNWINSYTDASASSSSSTTLSASTYTSRTTTTNPIIDSHGNAMTTSIFNVFVFTLFTFLTAALC